MRDLPKWLVDVLATAPTQPGCYLMQAHQGDVVYVGKANNLKARLSQYFAPNPGDTRFFVHLLEDVLGDIELVVTSNGKEALILENQLIKEHQPRFNVRLRDDKTFLSLRLGNEHPWPRLEIVRRRKNDGAHYFGPYDSASAIRNTLRVVNRHFRLRTCTDTEFRNRSRPCLEHQIGRCPAPCVLDVDQSDYGESIHDARMFLRGRTEPLVQRLKKKMMAASAALDFELAVHFRDQIVAVERSLISQAVHLSRKEDIDVIGLYRKGAQGVFVVLEVRHGVLLGCQHHLLKDVEFEDVEVLDDLLTSRYSTQPIPDMVLVPFEHPDAADWSSLLSERRARRCRLHHPKRGDKQKLVALAQENARTRFISLAKNDQDNLKTLELLQRRLNLKNLPVRIECYDISNIQGTDPVGSMVVAIDAQLAPSAYRHFVIRGPDTPDDYRMMREVLSRRFRKSIPNQDMPDLIVIDGGKGQLHIAVAVIEELELFEVEVASLAKERLLDEYGRVQNGASREGRPSGREPQKSPERVFRPGRKNPVVFRAHNDALYLLQRLRDEAHRFAIRHHRKRRRKRTLKTPLSEIRGVGPSRQKRLLRHFGSLKRLRSATVEEIAACDGISQVLARAIRRTLDE